jgi:hypothetical protein
MAKLDAAIVAGGLTADPRFFPNGDDFRGCGSTRPASRAAMPPATPTATPTDHAPVAHHAAEDTLLSLLVLGGSGLSLTAAIARQRLAAFRAKLTRPRSRP